MRSGNAPHPVSATKKELYHFDFYKPIILKYENFVNEKFKNNELIYLLLSFFVEYLQKYRNIAILNEKEYTNLIGGILLTFELNGSKPIYKQLMDEILAKIRSGELIPGAKLPTERELAQQLYVSRGTIKKAYKELADNNIIEIIQGSGTYVYAEKKLYDGGMRKQATNMINSLLDRLEFWDFPMEEIETLFHMCVTHRTRTSRPVRCAMIDCNSESLGIFKRQLSYLPDITLSAILVDSVIMDDTPEALLADYDLIFTTETHYSQITECLNIHLENLFPVSEALSQQCIISISTLPNNASIGIVTSSNKFANLICEEMERFCPLPSPLSIHFDVDVDSILQFIQKYDTIIISPNSAILEPGFSDSRLQSFYDRGGRLISFDYMIDRGSLIHIEELVSRILRDKYA